MHRVLRHIEAHLAEALDPASLARVANFSAFHFHRLFAAWTGERVGDHVRRRRLEVAATRLATQPDSSVLEIALSVGFGSAEAFSRSFKAHFAVPPGVYRRQQTLQRATLRNPDQLDRKTDQAGRAAGAQHGRRQPTRKESPMQVQLKTLAPVDVAYLRRTGAYGEEIGRFWMESVAPWMQANGLLQAARYGISHDDPSVVSPAKCRYDACVEVPAALALSGRAQRTTLPGGRHAVLGFRGSSGTIGEAWASLLRDWLPSSGLQADDRPCFEYYPPATAEGQNADAFACELCLPVREL